MIWKLQTINDKNININDKNINDKYIIEWQILIFNSYKLYVI